MWEETYTGGQNQYKTDNKANKCGDSWNTEVEELDMFSNV